MQKADKIAQQGQVISKKINLKILFCHITECARLVYVHILFCKIILLPYNEKIKAVIPSNTLY